MENKWIYLIGVVMGMISIGMIYAMLTAGIEWFFQLAILLVTHMYLILWIERQ